MCPYTGKDHVRPVAGVNPRMDKDIVDTAALELVACGGIVANHW